MPATHRPSYEARDQFKYWSGALLIHVVIGVLLVGFNWNSREAVIPQLAINAVVIDSKALNQLVRQSAPPSPPAPAEPDTRQQEELERQRQERERLKQEQERLKQEQVQREQLELQRTQEQQRLAAEEQRQEEQRKAQAAEQQRQKQEADKKRLAEIEQKQRDAELKRKADAEAKAQAAREAELAAQMAAEEGRTNAVNSGLLNQYVALIQQKVMRNWIKPATARSGLECEVRVVQATGGTVLSASVGKCNGDAAVRESIEAAVQRASPLPAPPDPRLFERNLILNFKPTE